MTSAPNIEMIASSLRNCSLNGGFRRRVRHQDHDEGSDDSEGITVELNSEVSLPYHWQQCLDIRTGQVYYVNWEDGTRTTVDPRTPSHFSTLSTPRSISSASRRGASTSSSGSGYTSASSVGTVAAAEWFSSATGGYGYNESHIYDDGGDEESSSSSSRSSAISSALSSFSPTDESASSGSSSDNGNNAAGHVLVAAGCRGCFMYFMVPKSAGLCPKCGTSGLVHLGRSNNASYA
ncbi:uncharacterized protein LOC124687152 [Lolium rigidum]|uniref:uncharacterized protein LOC124687152 n=1 Tax=Lolium rigidum TaxID=89674 RepID=UPI001F5DA758|nr:uncharacterized protein LOC124687152 [Lolium rigidum]